MSAATLAAFRQFPTSTRRLREIKQQVMEATADCAGCVTHGVSIHFFEDCWLAFHEKSNGRHPTVTHKVCSRDCGKTWLPYQDQFEPKEGRHQAVEYQPSDSSFPTRQW